MAVIELGSAWCPQCGDRLEHGRLYDRSICPNVNCKTNTVDWERPKEPGPVRLPTRAEIMADSRKGAWVLTSRVDIPMDRPIILAWPAATGNPPAWNMFRAVWDGVKGAYVDPENRMALPGERQWTHWHEDTLGTP